MRICSICTWFFNKNEDLPKHFSDSNIYMTVVRKTLSIALNKQENHIYNAGNVVKIQVDTIKNIRNQHDNVLELIVVKAPIPNK